MSALICGSLAFDTIMVFHDQFKNHILPEQVHILNVSFLVPDLRREFGGCAGNIAYNLNMLGGDGKPVGTIGEDFEPYARWMDECGVSRDHLRGRQGMIDHAAQFAESGVPFIFDPGQGMPMFDGDSLLKFAEQATWLAFNDYEAKLMMERTGKTLAQLAEMVEAVVVTRGGEGSLIVTQEKTHEIPVAPAKALVDPTGCGDAYRAGLLFGLMNGMDWETTGRIAALMGAIKIEHAGTQNHFVSMDVFKHRFEQVYDYSF
ncbi:MAG: carbohydrate kinase family protein [Candidatus Thiodiazotropha sp.]